MTVIEDRSSFFILLLTSLYELFMTCQGLRCAKCASFALLHLMPPGMNGHSLNLRQSMIEIEMLDFCVTQWEINQGTPRGWCRQSERSWSHKWVLGYT